ncbi:MAG: hypothetical protein K2X81_17895 [Candidatus Obscuribacterales bacterium]|nr:hypothetical protein [Candidatus Obscuribacterales bacterium]
MEILLGALLVFFCVIGFSIWVFVQMAAKTAGPKLVNEHELKANQGVWRTSAPFPNVWETVVRSLDVDPVMPNRRWAIRADLPYKEIILTATLDQEHGPICQATITANLKFEPLADGGTIINYTYTTVTNNLQNTNGSCERLKKLTNNRLRRLCAELSQDPNKGLPFQS